MFSIFVPRLSRPSALAGLLLSLLLLAGGAPLAPAIAQQDGGAAAGSSEEAESSGLAASPRAERLQSLLDRLKDDQARGELIADIEALIEVQRQDGAHGTAGQEAGGQQADTPPDSDRLLGRVSARMDAIARQLASAAEVVLRLPEVVTEVLASASDPEVRDRWIEIASKVAGVIAAALLVSWLVSRLLRRPVQAMESRSRESWANRALLLLVRGVLQLLPLAAFAAVAYAVLPLLEPARVTRLVTLALVNAHILARAFTVTGDVMIAARAPGLRLPRISDETAYYLRIWLRRVVVLGVYGYFALEAALLLGLEPDAQKVALKALGALLTAMGLIFILQNRRAVAEAIRGERGLPFQALRRRLGDVWHVLAMIYLVAIYLVWALSVEGGFAFLARATLLTLVVGAAMRGLHIAAERALDRGFHLTAEMQDRFPALEARANRYLPALRRAAQVLILGLGGITLLQVWGLNAFGWLSSGWGRSLGERILTILLIVVVALAFWEVISALIERFLRQRSSADGKSSARVLTLLPLIRNVVRVVLAVMVTLIVFSELGVDIGPLLAGAGVVGLAVGFGAQALVKDVITGAFILLEDAIAVGDWVEVSGVLGGVESMSIRSVKLRDLNGVVHVVPFGEIAFVTNMNRDFGFALVDIGVAYRENVDNVIEVLKEVAADLRQDETFGPLIIEDLEVLGLNNLADSAVEIRVRMKTQPLRQWSVRREYLRRIKKRFDELDIEIPFPHQTIYFGVDKQGGAPSARVRLEREAEKAEAAARERPANADDAAKGDPGKPAEERPGDDPKPGDPT